jgi:hypothetical protein
MLGQATAREMRALGAAPRLPFVERHSKALWCGRGALLQCGENIGWKNNLE